MPRPDPARRPKAVAEAVVRPGDLETLGLAANPSRLQALAHYLDLLLRWNSTYNLTAVSDPAAAWVQHALDCLAALPAVRARFAALPTPSVLDVGSGGGLPGVPWALWWPQAEITCVDTVGKKAAFIRQVAAELALPNLHARHLRVETLHPESFDLITARAFASLPDLVRLTRALLRPAGVWAALKGKVPSDEIAALPPDVDVFHVEPLQVPHLNAERCLVWMRLRGDGA